MNNKPKILIFSLAYYPFVGGAEVAIKEITDRLGDDFSFSAKGAVSASGMRPAFGWDMITCNLDGQQKEFERIGNINVYRIGKWRLSKYLFPWLAYRKAKQLHKKNNYNMIWAMMANQAGWAAMKFKKKYPRTKYLLTLQEGDSEWDIWIRTWFMRPIYKAIYKKADCIQAISNFLAERAKKLGAKCEISVVPNGVRVESPKSKVESQDIKRIITVSRLVKKNGIADLIYSIKLLVTDYGLPVTLNIIGNGKLINKLEKLVEDLEIKDKVVFLGEVSNEKVYEYLDQSDIFVRPSLSEGLGNAFLEAMSVGVPVIGTEVGGIPDFLEDGGLAFAPAVAKAMTGEEASAGKTGWFCEVKNPKSIAEKINYILNPANKEEIEKVVENARKMVEEKYNWNKIPIDIKNIFNKLINLT